MTDVKNYIIALLIIAVMRWLIPKFGKVVNWLIIRSVNMAEKLIKGSKLGAKKKQFVLKILRLFGIKATSGISELIDLTVDALNGKQDDIKSDISSNISDKIQEPIDKLNNN